MWCEILTDYDVLNELGRKVPTVINHMLKNKYVRYALVNTMGNNEYFYFYINDRMQIIEIDTDLGI